MARKPNIKWRKSDVEKLEKEIQRFNNKIYRTRNRNPELSNILPDTIKKADKLEMIERLKNSPRSEFNKTINSLDRFIRKGAEKPVISKTGNTVTNWEKREVGLKVSQINRARTIERKELENMEVTSRGEPVGLKRGEMGSERMNTLKPKTFNFDKIKGGKEWEKYKESVEKQSNHQYKTEKMDNYKKNYITAMQNTYGDYADDIVSMIESLPSDLVFETYYSEQEATIQFHYEKQAMELKLDVLEGIWSRVVDDYEHETNGRF